MIEKIQDLYKRGKYRNHGHQTNDQKSNSFAFQFRR